MTIFMRYGYVAFLGMALLTFAGCGGDDDGTTEENENGTSSNGGGHDDHGDTYAEIVAELEGIHAEVKSASEADNLKMSNDPLHHALHKVGDRLDHLEGYAKKEGMTDEQITEINEATEQLREAFLSVDGRVHDPEKGKGYDEVKEAITTGMATLKKHIPAS